MIQNPMLPNEVDFTEEQIKALAKICAAARGELDALKRIMIGDPAYPHNAERMMGFFEQALVTIRNLKTVFMEVQNGEGN